MKTDPPATLSIAAGVRYCVRHRVQLDGSVNRVCFRIWAAGDAEPGAWLCDISDAGVPRDQQRFTQAAFALFQHTGAGTINPPHTDRQPTWDEGKFTLPEEGASIWFEQGLWGRGVSLIQLLATKGGPAGSAGG